MVAIEVLETEIGVTHMMHDVNVYPQLWDENTTRQEQVWEHEHTKSIFLVAYKAIPGISEKEAPDEANVRTPWFDYFPNITTYIYSRFQNVGRVSLCMLMPAHFVHPHKDNGEYYRRHDRYHLVLQGRYSYHVGDESIIAEPGMLFRFDNQQTHWSQNLEPIERIAVIFDVLNQDD